MQTFGWKTVLRAKLTLTAAQLGPGFRLRCLHFQKRELVSWVRHKWFISCSATNFICFVVFFTVEHIAGQSSPQTGSLPVQHRSSHSFASRARKLNRKDSLAKINTAKAHSLFRSDDKKWQKDDWRKQTLNLYSR